MTYLDAASAFRGFKLAAVAVMSTVLALGLGGCESSSSIFGGGTAQTDLAPPPAPPVQAPVRKIALTPIIGAPDGIAKQMSDQLAEAGPANKFSVSTERDARGDFTLRGYMVAARDKAGTKVSYIWDVSDATGKRVHRITGEEIAAGAANTKDPWSSVTPAITKAIVDKSAAQLGSWLPNQPAAPAIASNTPVAAAGAASVQPVSAEPVKPASVNTATAAIGGDGGVSIVPTVAGAPGDGNSALTEALERELSRQGLALGEKPGATYRIEGKVAVGATKDGKQPIQIDWKVKDPQGKPLGTVSQKNEIPPGTLDGTWGKTADAAAAAAAQGIVKLLPQGKSTN